MSKFDEFINKEKFVEEGMYPGIEDESFKIDYTNKINLIAKDFMSLAKTNANDIAYREKIVDGLKRFGMFPDTEDRERICMYIEELMDIVGLESSKGILNKYMYGSTLE